MALRCAWKRLVPMSPFVWVVSWLVLSRRFLWRFLSQEFSGLFSIEGSHDVFCLEGSHDSSCLTGSHDFFCLGGSHDFYLSRAFPCLNHSCIYPFGCLCKPISYTSRTTRSINDGSLIWLVFTFVCLVSLNCANGKTGEWSFKASGRLTSFENVCNGRSDSL